MGAAGVLVESLGKTIRTTRRVCSARWAPSRFLARGDLSKQELGLAGERFALVLLRRAGYRPLATRLRTRRAELDLVFVRNSVLVVVEVKTGRAGSNFRPGEHFSPGTRERQKRAARELAGELGLSNSSVLLAEVTVEKGAVPTLILTRISTT